MQQQRGAAVHQRAAQNQQRIQIPGQAGVVGEHRIKRHHQRAEGNGAVAGADGADEGEHKSQPRHHQTETPGLAESELHRQRRHRKRGHSNDHVFDTAGEAVVQIHQPSGNNAQHQRHTQLRQPPIPHRPRRHADAEQQRQGGNHAGRQPSGSQLHRAGSASNTNDRHYTRADRAAGRDLGKVPAVNTLQSQQHNERGRYMKRLGE